MSGTKAGGIKARDKNLRNNPLHYQKMGALGGKAPNKAPKGFAAMTPERRSAAGKKGGATSRRNKGY